MIGAEIPQHRTVRTRRGRVVSFYEFGDPDGAPVLALHGTPASGAGFAFADAPARSRGIRLLAPDRPGVGYSDLLVPPSTAIVGNYPPELFAFADAVGVEQFSVLGYSGGGPYALGAAHADAARVRSAAIVAGAGQVGEWATLDEFEPTDRRLSWLATRAPNIARIVLGTSGYFARHAPRLSLWFAQLDMTPADREVMTDYPSARAAVALFTRALACGTSGVVADYAALARPWGFNVEEITVPIRCWHATADAMVPLRHSEELVGRIPHARLTRWDGEGHLALVRRVGEVLDGVVELTTG